MVVEHIGGGEAWHAYSLLIIRDNRQTLAVGVAEIALVDTLYHGTMSAVRDIVEVTASLEAFIVVLPVLRVLIVDIVVVGHMRTIRPDSVHDKHDFGRFGSQGERIQHVDRVHVTTHTVLIQVLFDLGGEWLFSLFG